MKIIFSNRFKKDFKNLDNSLKKIVEEKLKLLVENIFHPSLRTKKIQGKEEIFECSINMSIRITWYYSQDAIYLRTIGKHEDVFKNP
ncbi:MAG: hypothetical protein NTV16_07960 [Actinobacteria bacterium]|nr:hypothetical protein [Actinomycetota bacterium]